MIALSGVARAIWVTVPKRLARRVPWLAAVLADGSYLVQWPIIAVVAPIGALALGFSIGAWRYFGDESYVSSIAWPLLMLAPSAFGAALGLETALGFAVGDFFFYPHTFASTGVAHIWQELVPLVITYEVLLGLTVLLPRGAQPLAAGVTRLFARRLPQTIAVITFVGLSAAVAAMVAATWTGSAQVLVRPIESFRGGFPSPSLVQPLRQEGVFVVVLAAVLTVARLALERISGRDLARAASGAAGPTAAATPVPVDSDRPLSRQIAVAVIWAAVLTVLLAGLLDEPWQAIALFGALLLAGVLRSIVLPRVRLYASAVGRVPVLLRVVLLSLAGYGVGFVVLPILTDNPPFLPESWTPMVVAASIVIVLGAFILPGPPIARGQGRSPKSVTAAEAQP